LRTATGESAHERPEPDHLLTGTALGRVLARAQRRPNIIVFIVLSLARRAKVTGANMGGQRAAPFLCAVGLSTVAAIGSAAAQSVSLDKIEALEAQIAALQQEVRALKKKVNSTEKPVAKKEPAVPPTSKVAPAPPTTIVKMAPDNEPSICSADGLNCIGITGRLHLDAGGYHYRPNTASTPVQNLDDGVNTRRARIGVAGTFAGDWNFALIYDFGGSSDGFGGTAAGSLPGGGTSGIENAYLSYVGIKGLAIEAGIMHTLYSLEEATSSNEHMFIERASASNVATGIAAADFRSAAGARWFSDLFWLGAYLTGPTTGDIHVSQSVTPPGSTEQLGGFARAVWHVVNQKDFGVHIGGDAEALFVPATNTVTGIKSLTLSDRPELRIDPTSLLTTGPIPNVAGAHVYSGELAANYGPFTAQAEYFFYNIDRALGLSSLRFNGGYAQASWIITGESREYGDYTASYVAVIPKEPFSLSGGGWGAWEIAARYSTFDLNDRLGFPDGVAGGKQTIITAGLNWYLSRNIGFMLDYLHGWIDKQASATNFTDAGSKFDAIAMRTRIFW
jgi:phosphate-selective porin OprO/OprP